MLRETPPSFAHPVPQPSQRLLTRFSEPGVQEQLGTAPLSAELRSSERNPCSRAGPTERKEGESSAAPPASFPAAFREEPPPKRWESRRASGAHKSFSTRD